jgi:hypothetical protein
VGAVGLGGGGVSAVAVSAPTQVRMQRAGGGRGCDYWWRQLVSAGGHGNSLFAFLGTRSVPSGRALPR